MKNQFECTQIQYEGVAKDVNNRIAPDLINRKIEKTLPENSSKRTLNEKDAVQQILFRNKNNMMHESDALRKEIEEQIKGKQQISVSLARSKADHAQLEEQYAMECEAKKEVQRQYDNSLRLVFKIPVLVRQILRCLNELNILQFTIINTSGYLKTIIK